MTDGLLALVPCRHSEFRYHRLSSRASQQPWLHPGDARRQFAQGIKLFLDVSYLTEFLLRMPCLINRVSFSFVILQGLTGTASGFLQVVPLVMYYVKLFVFASTPRSIYKIKYTLRNVSWGTLFPGITLLAVISTFINSIPAYHTL